MVKKRRKGSTTRLLVQHNNQLALATHDWSAHCRQLSARIEEQERRIRELEADRSQPRLRLEDLHPKIQQRCHALFEQGHFEAAIAMAFKTVEVELRHRAGAEPTDVGTALVGKAFGGDPPRLCCSRIAEEQQAAQLLFRSAFGWFRNPVSHRFLEAHDGVRTFEALAVASTLMRLVEGAEAGATSL